MFGEWKGGVFADLWLRFTEKEAHGLTPLFTEYQSLTTKSDRLEYLSKSLASLQLELDLLRAKYPHPRQTVDELEEHAQEQIEAIISLMEKKEHRAAELAQKRRKSRRRRSG